MNQACVIVYFSLPAGVAAWPFISSGNIGDEFDIGGVVAFAMNYLFFSLPQITWLAISRFVRAPLIASHAGFLGSSLALAGLFVVFECCAWNENALGWFYYWPVAAFGMSILLGMVYASGRWRKSEA